MKSYSDIVGDGGSKIVEQVTEHRARITKNLSSVRTLLAIGSGKGGVGKSTLTMQLAFSFKQQGLKVSVLDADINGPCIARLAGIKNTLMVPGKNGLSVPKTKNGIGVISFGTLFAEPDPVNFESISQGESYVWRATKEFSVFGELLGGCDWGPLDILLIDLPPGVERTVQFAEYLGERVKLVLVTIPSDVSLGIVARTVSALKKTQTEPLGLIENMSGYVCPDCNEVKPLFPSTKGFDPGIQSLGQVPFDPKLGELCNQGLPLTDYPDSQAAKAIDNISKKILSMLGN